MSETTYCSRTPGFTCRASPDDAGVASGTCLRDPVSDGGVADSAVTDTGSSDATGGSEAGGTTDAGFLDTTTGS